MKQNETAALLDGFQDIVIQGGTITAYYQGEVYPRKFSMTIAELSAVLKKMPYHGEKLPHDAEAENMRMPPLVLTFYKHLMKAGRLLSDLELADQHLGRYYRQAEGGKVVLKEAYQEYAKLTRHPVSELGIRNRILRMYPSLVRDLHFYLLCHESGCFDKVSYSVLDDYNGYDLTVYRGGEKALVRLMADTSRSNYYNNRKYQRHTLDANIIDLKIKIGSKEKCGVFYLYNASHLQLLIQHLDGKNGR